MMCAYRRTGGLVPADELALRLGELVQQPISQVAKWIIAHQVVSFVWDSTMFLPVFQLDSVELRPRAPASAVVRELASSLSDWDLAVWFVKPNYLLNGKLPMDALAIDADSVLSAAKAERYFVHG